MELNLLYQNLKIQFQYLSIEGEVIEMPFDINHDLTSLFSLNEKLNNFPKEEV